MSSSRTAAATPRKNLRASLSSPSVKPLQLAATRLSKDPNRRGRVRRNSGVSRTLTTRRSGDPRVRRMNPRCSRRSSRAVTAEFESPVTEATSRAVQLVDLWIRSRALRSDTESPSDDATAACRKTVAELYSRAAETSSRFSVVRAGLVTVPLPVRRVLISPSISMHRTNTTRGGDLR